MIIYCSHSSQSDPFKGQFTLLLKALQWLPITLSKVPMSFPRSALLCVNRTLDVCVQLLALSLLLQSSHMNFLQFLQHIKNVYTSETAQGCHACPPDSHMTHILTLIIFLPKRKLAHKDLFCFWNFEATHVLIINRMNK